MARIGRRDFLRAAAITTGGIVASGGVDGLLGTPAGAQTSPTSPPLVGTIPDMRDGKVRLHVPAKFRYRSFHDTEDPVPLDEAVDPLTGRSGVLPGRHDGMTAFPGPNGNVLLVRNHEINGAGDPFGAGDPYDPKARSGTTTTLVTPFGEPLWVKSSLNGTMMNCSGGRMPWGSWISCEETVNGPDVGPDFTGVPNVVLTERHGFIFEVPARGQSTREPITSAGRFAHEAAAFNPQEGILYLTEDDFGFPSGFYRFIPATNPMSSGRLRDKGRLEVLRVVGRTTSAELAAMQTAGTTYQVDWVDIDDPAPSFPYTPGEPAPTTNNEALTHVARQGWAQGAAHFSRLEGCTFSRNRVYFSSTQGGGPAETSTGPIADGYGNGSGQIWSYSPRTSTLTCEYQSPGPDVLDFPDNVTARSGKALVICEDNVNNNFIRALTRDGRLVDIALNRLTSTSGVSRFDDEFAGAVFSPDGGTLFVNIQASAGLTFAIWGPWDRLGV